METKKHFDITKFLIRYGIAANLLLLFLFSLFIVLFVSQDRLGLFSGLVAIISVFLMITIMYINNRSQEECAKNQIRVFEENSQKQINSMQVINEKQIYSFNSEVQKIILELKQVTETQKDTAQQQINNFELQTIKQISTLTEQTQSQINNFEKQAKNIISGLHEIVLKQENTTNKQIEAFAGNISEVVSKLEKVVETQETSTNQIVNNFEKGMDKLEKVLNDVSNLEDQLVKGSIRQLEIFNEIAYHIKKIIISINEHSELIKKLAPTDAVIREGLTDRIQELGNDINSGTFIEEIKSDGEELIKELEEKFDSANDYLFEKEEQAEKLVQQGLVKLKNLWQKIRP